jgi:hypothetical protein
MKKHLLIFLLLATFLGNSSNNLNAQTLFNPNTYSGWVSTPTNAFATIPGTPGVTFTQILRGSGNGFSTATDGVNSSKWNNPSANAAITANQFLTFSASSDASTTFEIDSLLFILGRSGAGPDSCILLYKSTNTGNNFIPVVSAVRVIVNPSTTLSIIPASPIQVAANDSVVFRFVAWHATSTLGTMKVMNNTTVYGKATAAMTNSIAAPTIQTSNAICVSSIQGDSIHVTFNASGVFNNGNMYSLELSDGSGNFSSPLIVGSITSNLNTGSIHAFIPAGIASANYQLRITSSDPAMNGLDTTQLLIFPGMTLDPFVIQPNCPDSSGAISLTITGGSGLLQYNWSNGESTQDIINLQGGNYSVNVIDQVGCSVDSSFNLLSLTPFSVIESITNVVCSSDSTGSIQVSVTGGTAPYSVTWSGNGINQTGFSAMNLPAGTYLASILDGNNCPYSSTLMIHEPNPILVNESIVHVMCHSEESGSIQIAVTGGTVPYLISWSGNGINQTGDSASNLSSGIYDVTIVDDNNCSYTNQFVVLEPAAMSISSTIVNATCLSCNGSITLSVNGGVVPYSFDWDNNSNLQNISAVPGQYCVTISDANSCELDTCFTISSTAGIADKPASSLIQVYPNPVSDAFQIIFSSNLKGIRKEVLVVNMLGEVVLKETVDPALEQLSIQTGSWPNGTYNYQIYSEAVFFERGKINVIH